MTPTTATIMVAACVVFMIVQSSISLRHSFSDGKDDGLNTMAKVTSALTLIAGLVVGGLLVTNKEYRAGAVVGLEFTQQAVNKAAQQASSQVSALSGMVSKPKVAK